MSDASWSGPPPESNPPWVATPEEPTAIPTSAPAGAIYYDHEQNQLMAMDVQGQAISIGSSGPGNGNISITPGPDGDVVIGTGRSGAVRIAGDLLVEGSVLVEKKSPGHITLAAQSEPAHILLFIHGDGKVDLGEPMTQAQVADLMAQRHMDTHVSTLMVVVSELLKVREELERLRNRIG